MFNLRPVTFSVLFILSAAIFNIYDQRDSWNWNGFMLGVITGLPVLTCHVMKRGVGTLLFAVSFIGLALTAAGALDGISVDRLFFCGMSLGVVFGVLPAFLIARENTVSFLITSAHLDGYSGLAALIQKKLRDKQS